MKKIACLLVAVMLLACLPLTAFAAKAGETVSIEFTTENKNKVSAIVASVQR